MSGTSGSGNSEFERASTSAAAVDEQEPLSDRPEGPGETERVRQRLGAALTVPLVSLVVLALLVAAVSASLIEAEHISALAAPLLAGLAALGIVVVAWRGWLEHDPRISFGRLLSAILVIGVVVSGATVGFLRLNSEPALPEGTIAVLAREYELVSQSWSAPEGEITLNFESGGQIGHTLTIEGLEDELLLKVSPSSPMDSASVQLEEGVYTLYCDLKGHRELGMEATLEITDEPVASG
jgi:hypothetical protein